MTPVQLARKSPSLPHPKLGLSGRGVQRMEADRERGVQLGWKLGRQHPETSHLYFEVPREAEEECVPLITMNSSGPGPGKV